MDKVNAFKQAALQQGYSEQEVNSFMEMANSAPKMETPTFNNSAPDPFPEAKQEYAPSSKLLPEYSNKTSIIGFNAPVTQKFGNYNPGLEKYSRGVNLGTDFKVPSNTPLAVPPGQWKVETASPGWNNGSGNYVRLRNTKTGESLGFEHLSKIGVKPGQVISGGQVVCLSGGAQGGSGQGNSTGAHASIPYQDANGNYQDILNTPYARYLYGS